MDVKPKYKSWLTAMRSRRGEKPSFRAKFCVSQGAPYKGIGRRARDSIRAAIQAAFQTVITANGGGRFYIPSVDPERRGSQKPDTDGLLAGFDRMEHYLVLVTHDLTDSRQQLQVSRTSVEVQELNPH